MAWTSPRTWSACEVVTAAIMNTHVRDNLNQTFPALVTTKGDSIWATAANAGTRLAVGADKSIIVANSACNAGVQWANDIQDNAVDHQVGFHTSTGTATACGGVEFKTGFVATGSPRQDIAFAYGGNGFRHWIRTQHSSGCGVGNAFEIYVNNGAVSSDSASVATGNTRVGGFYGLGASGGMLGIGNVNGGASANSSMTFGVTINQGAATNEVLAFLNSSTSQSQFGTASTFGHVAPLYTDVGGLLIAGATGPAGGGATRGGLRIEGETSNTHATRSSTASAVVVMATCSLNNVGDNAFSFVNSSCTQVIVSGAGDIFANAAITASAYDEYDDVGLVRALELERAPLSVVRDVFDSWVRHNRADLERLDIAHFNENGSIFVSVTGLQRLQSGAIWQMHKRMEQMQTAFQAKIDDLERRLLAQGPGDGVMVGQPPGGGG